MCLGNVILLLIFTSINHLILAFITEEFTLDINELTGDGGGGGGDTDIFNQAYVQTGSELYYFKDISYQDNVILPIPTEFSKEMSSDAKQKIQKNIQIFDQEVTDFGSTVFGIPVQKVIAVNNPTNSDVIFETVFTIGKNFHGSFMENKSLSPNQHSSFRVYFLPLADDIGVKEELIVLQTSIGKFIHKVRGEVIGNPYRIRSFLGITVPLNATISAPIQLHNPHANAYMRILEIYTNDCHLQMETATTFNDQRQIMMDGPEDLLLEPFETKEIGFAKILGGTERNSTTFIFIKFRLEQKRKKFVNLNRVIGNDQQSFTLIVPLEVEVTRRRGLFSTSPILDFNLLKAGDQISPLKISVFSTLERGIEIESVNVDSKASSNSKGVYLQFEQRPPISIKPTNRGQPSIPLDIASINVDTNLETNSGIEENNRQERLIKREGFVVAESRGGNYNITIPFKAIIYKGALLHNPMDVSFHADQLPNLSRIITLTNTNPYALTVHSVGVAKNAKDYFKASLISSAVTLLSDQSLPVFIIHYLKKATANFTSTIFIQTNLTTFQIPLKVFEGDLKINVHSLEQNCFQFGAIKYGEKRSIQFTLSNPNPIPLIIQKFHSPFRELSVELIDSQKLIKCKSEQQSNFCLPAHSSATFKMCLSFGSKNKQITDGNGNHSFEIRTQFSTYQFPIMFNLINSTTFLTVPKKIQFHDAFIGKILKQPLMILNKFPHELRILSITINESHRRHFSLSLASNKSQIIQSNASMNIANITFAPTCSSNDCYLGIPLTTTDGQWFTYGMKLPQNLAEIDSYLYSRLRRKWAQMREQRVANATVNLDTDRIRGLEVPIEGHLTWPRLFSHPVVHFPLTAVGNFSIVNLTITNPSMYPIIVQILPIVIYPDGESLIELLQDELPAPLIDPIEINETLTFSLRDTELFTLKPGSPVPKLREEVEQIIEGPLPRFTLSLLLRPGSNTRVRIGFLPSDYSLRSSVLIIRNNLTALEPVVLYGRGARINMEIDNKTARTQPLLFELESAHLTDCTNPRRQLHRMPTTLTVRRSFQIRNTGEIGFSVQNISINGMPCQNRGFRILNCDRFRLEPNETTYLDLAFTPDFLFSVSEATLQIYIHMNGTPWSFEMASIVPKHLLAVCHNALPRPPFEAVIYQTCVLALIFCLICVISCAYLEGDRVVMNALKEQFIQEQILLGGDVFDLNAPPPTETTQNSQNREQIGKNTNIVQKRGDFLQISENDGNLKKLFWRIMNFILLIFSHIWPLIRASSGGNSQAKSIKSAGKSKNPLPGESTAIIIDTSKKPNSSQTAIKSINWNIKKSQIIYDLNQQSASTTLNDDSVSSSTTGDDAIYAARSSEQQILNGNGGKKQQQQRRKKKLLGVDGEIETINNNLPLFMRNISSAKTTNKAETKQQQQILANETIKDSKEKQKNEKKAAGKLTNYIETETKLPFTLSTSSSEMTSSSSISALNGTKKQKNQRKSEEEEENEIFNHPLETSQKLTTISPTFSALNGTKKQKNSRKFKAEEEEDEIFHPPETSPKAKVTTKTISGTNSEDADDEKLPSWQNSYSIAGDEEDKLVFYNGNGTKEEEEEEEELMMSDESESSDLPEWADETVEKGNLDEELDALAKNSATLFGDTLNGNDGMLANLEKTVMGESEQSELDRVIEQLTCEYRKRLRKVLMYNTLDDILTMPPDLTPNIEKWFENLNDGNSSPTERKPPSPTKSHHQKSLEKPPGHELSKMRQQKEQEKSPAATFLFNINDPIWKPIGLFEDEEDWPKNNSNM